MPTVTTSLTTELVDSVSESSIKGAVYVSPAFPDAGYAVVPHPPTERDAN